MKIAVCQLDIQFEEKEENIERAREFMETAAEQRAELILFPEMSFTGFSMNTQKTGEYLCVEDCAVGTGEDGKNAACAKAGGIFGGTSVRMKEFARRYHLAIGYGWVEKGTDGYVEGSLAKNHYTVIDENGDILGDYVKLHPFRYSGEHRYFAAGTDTQTFVYRGICFGMSICYDLRFPEIYQQMSKTAHVILVPANWPAVRTAQWRTLLMARAIENQSYMIGINCYGTQEQQYYCGNSCVVTPQGEMEFEICDAQGMQIYELTDDVENMRAEFPVRQDRRPALYRTFY